MELKGFMYILLGGFLVGFSYYITSINPKMNIEKFMLFIIVGIGFILFGTYRLLKALLEKANESDDETKQERRQKKKKSNAPNELSVQYNQANQNNGRVNYNQQMPHQTIAKAQAQSKTNVKYCSSCGSAARHFDKFCYKCGNRNFHHKTG